MSDDENDEPWWVKPGLAALAALIFSGALVGSTFIDDATLRTAMYSTASSGFLLALGFFFGAAASGAGKDKTIAKIATKDVPPT